jgi:hypothetical protein
MQTKSLFVVGRDRELSVLLDYVTTGAITSDFSKRCSEKEEENDEEDESKAEKRQQDVLEGMRLIFSACLIVSLM